MTNIVLARPWSTPAPPFSRNVRPNSVINTTVTRVHVGSEVLGECGKDLGQGAEVLRLATIGLITEVVVEVPSEVRVGRNRFETRVGPDERRHLGQTLGRDFVHDPRTDTPLRWRESTASCC